MYHVDASMLALVSVASIVLMYIYRQKEGRTHASRLNVYGQLILVCVCLHPSMSMLIVSMPSAFWR